MSVEAFWRGVALVVVLAGAVYAWRTPLDLPVAYFLMLGATFAMAVLP